VLQSSPPKPHPHRTSHPCRKIVFSISAKDQGSRPDENRGRYYASWTWFDANVIPQNHEAGENATQIDPPQPLRHFGGDDPLLLPRAHKLQNNPRGQQFEHNTIVWHYLDDIAADSAEAEEIEQTLGRGRATLDGSTVRGLQVGDSISVMGRARFPGWHNEVERVSVRVFWSA
jgi:hypothetical protein